MSYGTLSNIHIETPSSAAAMFFAALPREQREERVFVLPLDAQGRVLAKPILVSVGHEDGTDGECCPCENVASSNSQFQIGNIPAMVTIVTFPPLKCNQGRTP